MYSGGLHNRAVIKTVQLKCILLFIVLPWVVLSQADKKATQETKLLYRNLFNLSHKGVMFGHQDALAYGLNADQTRWIGRSNTSDVKILTGQHPAVVGHDLGHLELNKPQNLDDVPFNEMRRSIQTVYAYGGVNTLSWHPNNPLDFSKSTWDKMDSTIHRILNDKKNLKAYKKTLTQLAGFFKSLKGPQNELIPVVFRPYHEHTGSWFWWGADHCTPEEYKSFWQMTVKYLVRRKKVHNLLFAYSTDNFRSEQHYLERYPGDKYIDLLGFDTYHRNAPASDSVFIANAQRMVATIKKLGQEKNKLYAITETGLEKVTESDWWTRVLYSIIRDTGLSYVLVWRNGRPDHFYAPFEGQGSAGDFKTFFDYPTTFFEMDVSTLYKP